MFHLKKCSKVGDSSISRVKLKSAMQYTPMSLPLHQDKKDTLHPKFAFELNLDEKSSKGGKFKFFTKQTDAKKEKTFLGSPKLHRAMFHKGNTGVKCDDNWHTDSTRQVSLR